MILENTLIPLLLFVLNFKFSDGSLYKEKKNYGEPCAAGRCSYDDFLTCTDNICQCLRSSIHVTYNEESKPVCAYRALFINKCTEPCEDGQFCDSGMCNCIGSDNGTAIIYSKKCYEVEWKKPMESCFIKEKAHLCDTKEFSYCKNSHCICYSDFFFNSTSKECELKSESTVYKKHGYKGMPEEYCVVTSDCVEGLSCNSNNFTCRCPSSCSFAKEKQMCDCGELVLETPHAVLWVGSILGLLSVVFWSCLIKSTLKKRREKDNRTLESPPGCYQPTESNHQGVELTSRYPLTPGFGDGTTASPYVPPRDEPPSYNEAVSQDPKCPAPLFPPPPAFDGFSPWNAGNNPTVDPSGPEPLFPPPPSCPPADSTYSSDPSYPVNPAIGLSAPAGPYPVTTNAGSTDSNLVTPGPYPVTPPYPGTPITDSFPVTPATGPYPLTPITSSTGPYPVTPASGPYPVTPTTAPTGPYPITPATVPTGPYPLPPTAASASPLLTPRPDAYTPSLLTSPLYEKTEKPNS